MMPHTRRIWLLLAASPLLLLLLAPLLALLARIDGTMLLEQSQAPMVRDALLLSLRTTGLSLLLSVAAGTPLAYALARGRLPGRRLIELLVDIPLVLPPAVAGIALLLTFGRRGWLGAPLEAMGIRVAFTPLAVVLAQTFVSASHYVKSAQTGFQQLERDLLEAAAIDGASDWRRFWYVSVPLCWPSLFSGALSCWARALGEFGATIIVAGNLPGRTQTMPLAIYLGFERDPQIAIALALILLLLALFTLALVRWTLDRQRQA